MRKETMNNQYIVPREAPLQQPVPMEVSNQQTVQAQQQHTNNIQQHAVQEPTQTQPGVVHNQHALQAREITQSHNSSESHSDNDPTSKDMETDMGKNNTWTDQMEQGDSVEAASCQSSTLGGSLFGSLDHVREIIPSTPSSSRVAEDEGVISQTPTINSPTDEEGKFIVHLTRSQKKKQREKAQKALARWTPENSGQNTHNLRSKGNKEGNNESSILEHQRCLKQ